MDNKAIAFARDNAQLSSLLMGYIVLPDKEGVLLRNGQKYQVISRDINAN